jgi:RNA polymerase sigma-70 factor, ECF subfamily
LKTDRDAYADLVREHHGRVLRLCQVLLSNPIEAEDAAQDVFVKAYQSLPSFRADSSFSTWITRIAHNHCMDLLRRRSRQRTEAIDTLPESALPTQNGNPDKPAQELLAGLKPEYKEILALREVSGLSYDEIAAQLRCSLDAVKARLRRARQELHEKARHFSGTSNV